MGPLEVFMVLAWFACAAGAGEIAARKGRERWLWMVIGFILGLIGVLIAAVIGPAQPRTAVAGGYAQPPAAPLPPEGWYPDPAGSGDLRWWDGTRWAESIKPAAVEPPRTSDGPA